MKKSHNCRFCDTKLTVVFVDLGMSPLANSFLSKESLEGNEPFYPLQIFVCDNCFLVQLEEFESPNKIFSDYAYFASYSETWVKHAKNYVDMMINRFGFNTESQVIELASNDGYLLQHFKNKNIPALGIEPAVNVAKVSIEKGIPTITRFFGVETAKDLVENKKQADLLLGNNVLAHVPNLHDFVEGMKILLKPGGIITMEFPHILQLIQQNQFDTIYHEHFSYFSLFTVEKVFSYHQLTIFDVDEIPTHGGSLRIYAKHDKNCNIVVSQNVYSLLEKEKSFGLTDLLTYKNFEKKVESTREQIRIFFKDAKNSGKKIVGYGAPAKANTLLNYCGIGLEFIDYTVDRSPHKQGLYLPGTHIPILSPDKISETKPDYLIILPWNLKDEIMEQMKHIRKWGGKFVVLISEVKIYS